MFSESWVTQAGGEEGWPSDAAEIWKRTKHTISKTLWERESKKERQREREREREREERERERERRERERTGREREREKERERERYSKAAIGHWPNE